MKLTTKEYLSKRRCHLTFSKHIAMELKKSCEEIHKLHDRLFCRCERLKADSALRSVYEGFSEMLNLIENIEGDINISEYKHNYVRCAACQEGKE